MNYLLDANTYIEARNHYYGMDICPGYWHWLDLQFEGNLITSVEPIYAELKNYGDDLSDWVIKRKAQFIDVTDEETQIAFADIAQFLADGDYNPGNRDNFLAGADPWLIAKAKTIGSIVVTHETKVPDESRKVKIPNVCSKFGVEFVGTFGLLRALEAKFILKQTNL